MSLLFRHFWAVPILVNLVNSALCWARARKDAAARPTRARGYRLLLHVLFLLSNVPWIVMGVGVVIGGVPTVFHFLRPRDGDPWVIAFHVTVMLLLLAWLVWLFSGGPEWLVKRWGAPGTTPTVPRRVKLFMGVPLAMVILGMPSMWLIDVDI